MRLTANPDLLTLTEAGLYCPEADLYIDPWRRVERAVITHAHSDHARPGMGRYLCAERGAGVLRVRVGDEAAIDTLGFGETLEANGVRLSLHPAGHVLGSAQVRLELDGEIVCVSGDYKLQEDPTCDGFETVRCHTFITESTFGLPIYRWPDPARVFDDIDRWWRGNQATGRASLLMGYALGKAQRALAGLNPETGPIFIHGSLLRLNEEYRRAGVTLPPMIPVSHAPSGTDWSRALIFAPPSVMGTTWVRRFGEFSSAFLSGWMAIRGTRRRGAVDRGFVLSDHVDWPDLMSAISDTRAERVWVTHGYTGPVVRTLTERGLWAATLTTEFQGETEEPEEPSE